MTKLDNEVKLVRTEMSMAQKER